VVEVVVRDEDVPDVSGLEAGLADPARDAVGSLRQPAVDENEPVAAREQVRVHIPPQDPVQALDDALRRHGLRVVDSARRSNA
jgi:hypothetical protein